MDNIIIVYNPKHKADIIQEHINILKKGNKKVAFGNIKSNKQNMEQELAENLETIYKNANEKSYLQLFLTDYSSLHVAKVVEVLDPADFPLQKSNFTPSYYKTMEQPDRWYIIEDIRELVKNDFIKIRDEYLPTFTTPNFTKYDSSEKLSFSMYDNKYVYPIIITIEKDIDYFEDSTKKICKYYEDIDKTEDFKEIRNNLIKYAFGDKYILQMHPYAIDSITHAEITYNLKQKTKTQLDYIGTKYVGIMEYEIDLFMKELFKTLKVEDPQISNIEYTEKNAPNTIKTLSNTPQPDLYMYNFLLTKDLVKKCIEDHKKHLGYYILVELQNHIKLIQKVKNAIHSESQESNLNDIKILREKIIGISCDSIIIEILKKRELINKKRIKQT